MNNPLKMSKSSDCLFEQTPHKKRYMKGNNTKKCSTSLIIKEMQVKITKRYHFRHREMAKIKKTNKTKCWQRYEATRTFSTLVSIKCYNHFEELFGSFLWSWTYLYSMTQQFHLEYIPDDSTYTKSKNRQDDPWW